MPSRPPTPPPCRLAPQRRGRDPPVRDLRLLLAGRWCTCMLAEIGVDAAGRLRLREQHLIGIGTALA